MTNKKNKNIVEYLAIFKKTDSFCDSIIGLSRLLKVDSKISINNDVIMYDNDAQCVFRVDYGNVEGKEQRYFHLKFLFDTTTKVTKIRNNQKLLRAVRNTILKAQGEISTLRDDILSQNAYEAYPMIHNIENLMRRLIVNFMLVTVGREWSKDSLPQSVKDAVKKSKSNGSHYLNVLHSIDFIHLGEFLFLPYSRETVHDLYEFITKKNKDETIVTKDLLEFVPKSNWKRYFSELVDCEDLYLKSRWEKLYALRCRVAHNALLGEEEVELIKKLINEVQPKIEDAINKLAKVEVPPSEVEYIAESAIQSVSSALGVFIQFWQKFELAVVRRVQNMGRVVTKNRRVFQGKELKDLGLLSQELSEEYKLIRDFRNAVVHGQAIDIPVSELEQFSNRLKILIEHINSFSYLGYLATLTEEVRNSEIEFHIPAIACKIGDEQQYLSCISSTNALGWTVDYVEILKIDSTSEKCTVKVLFSASGENNEDRPYCGNAISGTATIEFDDEGFFEINDFECDVKDWR